MSILCNLDLPLQRELLINPILNWYTLFSKIRPQTVISSYGYGKFRVHIHTYTLPIFLPEIGCMTALDITSNNIRQEFEEKKMDFESFYSKNEILTSKLYNFNPSLNRVVSWGNYNFHTIQEEYYRIYIAGLVTDLLLSPSLLTSGELCSPLRWFRISSHGRYNFETTVNYNTGILHIKKEDIKNAEKITVWLGEPVDLFRTECGFIEIGKNGLVRYRKLQIFYTSDPTELMGDVSSKGNYFISLLISLNNYRTSFYSKALADSSINIVDIIFPLVYSHYDLLMHLFPYFVKLDSLSERLIIFDMPVTLITKILSRFEKFGEHQSREWIDSFNRIFENLNPFIRVFKINNRFYRIKIVNPAIIYCIIGMCLTGGSMQHRHAKIVLENIHLLTQELETPDLLKLSMVISMPRFSRISEYRGKNMKRYVLIFRKINDF